MNRIVVAGGFVVAVIGAGIACGTFVPVAYGAGEATPGVTGTGILGTLMTLVGGATSFFQLFKGQGTADLLKRVEDLAGNIIGKPQTVETVTVEVALVTLFTVCAKNGDTANLATVSSLANSLLGKK